MRRRLVTVAIFLLAGAAVNVAVAWGFAGWAELHGDQHFIASPPVGDAWPCDVPADWPARAGFGMTETGLGWTIVSRWTYVPRRTYDAQGQRDVCVLSLLYGWPRRSLSVHTLSAHTLHRRAPRATFLVHAVASPWRERCTECGAALVDPSICTSCNAANVLRIGAGHWPLPVGPLWPGFAVNTLFYAAILWLIIPGPFALRRFIRRRRGLCPACGYDLRHGEHKACPECGLAA